MGGSGRPMVNGRIDSVDRASHCRTICCTDLLYVDLVALIMPFVSGEESISIQQLPMYGCEKHKES